MSKDSKQLEINVGLVKVNTHIIETLKELKDGLDELLSIAQRDNVKSIVALDIQKQLHGSRNPNNRSQLRVTEIVDTLILCSAQVCLIIRLAKLSDPSRHTTVRNHEHVMTCVSRFLQLTELTFVGIRMQYCLEALENDYGIKCRNAFELSKLRPMFTGEDVYMSYTLVDLAYEMTQIPFFTSKDEAKEFCNADGCSITSVEAAAGRAYLCFYIGNFFRGGYVTRCLFWNDIS